ncbi:MAG: hypothetical protein JXJ18_10880 [Rhodobacteraceae bacterium]|nr:hypothetical protein [Paracoccaceae bacterium]
MSEEPETWHMMPVAILAILWSLGGAADYVLTQYNVAPYLPLFTQPQSAYFTALPAWADAAWAIAVWGGLLGAILLFLRSGAAPFVLGLAALSMVGLSVWLIGFASPPLAEVSGLTGVYLMIGASAVALLFYFYARQMRVAGALG